MRILFLLLMTVSAAFGQVTSNEIYSLTPTELRARAMKGEAPAQWRLADLLRSANALGVKKDYAESMKWMKKAHDQGYLQATYAMGDFYQSGWSVPRDLATALKYYREAAGKGWPAAQAMLGRIYLAGIGMNANKSEGMKWMNLAINQRDVSAPINLAYYSENGLHGLRKDKVQAAAYYAVAVEFGAKGGPESRLEELKAQMTPEQKAEAIKITKALLLTVAPPKDDANK